MPTLRDQRKSKPLKILHIGDSGCGKTGALASVINNADALGLKRIVIADWDDGLDILFEQVDDAMKDRVYFETLRDNIKTTLEGVVMLDNKLEQAWARGTMLMQKGIGDSGPASSWGMETLFVEDTLTGMGDAAINWAIFSMNVTDNWKAVGEAMRLQDKRSQHLKVLRCHSIMNAHIRYMGGGGKIVQEDKKGSKLIKEADSNVDGQAYPSALGRVLPPQLPRHFNMMIEGKLHGQHRVIRTVPEDRMALKCPIDLPEEMPQETALLTIFEAWLKAMPKEEAK